AVTACDNGDLVLQKHVSTPEYSMTIFIRHRDFCDRRSARGPTVRAFTPVDASLIASIQNLDRQRTAEIGPSPIDEGFDPLPYSMHNRRIYSQPRCKGDGTVEFVSPLANFRHGRIAADHRHDSFVAIMKRS